MASTTLDAQLESHLTRLEQDPSEPIDDRLFDSCSAFLAAQLVRDQQQLIQLITRLSSLLRNLQQDPSPVVRLLSKLVEPFEFEDILRLDPPVDFVGILDKSALPFNLLALKITEKATRSAKDAAIVAGMPGVVQALVILWLSTSDLGVAELSSSILLNLLRIDKETAKVQVHGVGETTVSGGQGLVWRRLFGDRDVYGLLYSLPSFKSTEIDGLSKREKSIAQARLLSSLPVLGSLDWDYLTRSHQPDIEEKYGLETDEGLLHFVCLHLIDYKDDVLLHMNLIQFFADMIRDVKRPSSDHR